MDCSTLADPAGLSSLAATADLLVVDCRFDLGDEGAGQRAWARAHIPGAVYAHLDHDLSAPVRPDSGRHPLPDAATFARTLSGWGVTPETRIVAYDASAGMIASRLWWMLRWLGHEHVAVLDGGLDAWEAAGGVLDRSVATRRPCRFAPRPRAQLSVSTAELVALLQQDACLLVDARSAERFEARHETIDPVAGHVPGAISLACQLNLGPDGRFRGREALRSLWEGVLAGRPTESLVSMCGSGVTACHNLLSLEHAGLPGGRLYAGSWSEWIRDPARPVATGPA